ncbi:MAG: cation:proton antiporter [Hyphomicrobiaceae bacterium]|nr:cation:proton antiporter [Hyphomicrobiaceae bacterium]
MYSELVHLLQELKPPYILLVQACIIVFFPYFLWRVLGLERWFPLGVVQIFSGVLLGPSIFGAIDAAFFNPSPHFDPSKPVNACTNPQARELFNAIFGTTCYHGTQIVNRAAGIASVATIAVCLFGFIAGTDADKELIRKSGRSVLSIGFNGMLFGWALATVAGYFIYLYFPAARGANASLVNFPIAFGLVIAVSALPVLALILRGLDITRRRMGAVALAAASIADTMMWLGLGIVVALALGGSLPVALSKAAAGALLSIGFIKLVISPVFDRLLRQEAPESAILTLTALSIFISSAITGITELHPVLGAFVAGYFLPDKVREMAAHRLDQTTILVLMPFFFLNTGLNTVFDFFDPNVWILFLISSFLCVFGKMIGHGVAARMTGESWPFAMSIGMLLQTKGLMGLIVIVVFLEKEVVSPLMFSAAVFMCMFSTGLPTPAMRAMFRIYGDELKDGGRKASETPILVDGAPVSATPALTAGNVLARLAFPDDIGNFPVAAPNVVLGRHSEDDIHINDIRVSRHHARLTLTHDGKFEIHNLTADRADANPILINGVAHEHAVLAEGDKVALGDAPPFTFHYVPRAS